MTHSSAWWRRHAGDERNNRLGVGARVVLLKVVCSHLLSLTANLSDHDNTGGFVVSKEDFEAINKVGTVEGIATNTDAQGLSETDHGSLVDRFVRKSTRTADYTNLTGQVDVA